MAKFFSGDKINEAVPKQIASSGGKKGLYAVESHHVHDADSY